MHKFSLTRSFKNLKQLLFGFTSFSFLLGVVAPVKAQLQIVEPTAGPLSVYDQGGILNANTNGGFYMYGLEVAPNRAGVFVAQSNGMPVNASGAQSTQNRLIKSTGMGTATQIGATLNVGNVRAWGNDLTRGSDGLYYIVVNTGVWGFDPTGQNPVKSFATWPSRGVGSASLSFSADGQTAFSVSDWPQGVFKFVKGGTTFPAKINTTAGLWDDHIFLPDGRMIICGEVKTGIVELMPNGSLVKRYDFTLDTDVTAAKVGAYGTRCVRHPVTGDIYWMISFGNASPEIVRIKANFSDATIFAKASGDLRDMEFGPRSSGASGYSLYVSHNSLATGVGTIFEIPMN